MSLAVKLYPFLPRPFFDQSVGVIFIHWYFLATQTPGFGWFLRAFGESLEGHQVLQTLQYRLQYRFQLRLLNTFEESQTYPLSPKYQNPPATLDTAPRAVSADQGLMGSSNRSFMSVLGIIGTVTCRRLVHRAGSPPLPSVSPGGFGDGEIDGDGDRDYCDIVTTYQFSWPFAPDNKLSSLQPQIITVHHDRVISTNGNNRRNVHFQPYTACTASTLQQLGHPPYVRPKEENHRMLLAPTAQWSSGTGRANA
ncbi:hypothetical protein QBC45DRAFT_437447 [Copromyces sp. CBS 386.78]|nr:hypothetical protein QBC45DRAFT_437447 [Copromyces sp. CBS 386.78]